MNVIFNKTEKDIFGGLLEQAEQEMSNNGCNDYPVLVTNQNKDELITLIIDIDPEDDQEWSTYILKQVVVGKIVYLTDWMLLSYLKKKIIES